MDDNPERISAIVDSIARRGADVEVEQDYESAGVRLASAAEPIDVLVSDLDEARLGDLDHLIKSQGFPGTMVFFTARVTPARRRMAAELGALTITNDPAELVAALEQQVRNTTGVEGARAARARGPAGRILLDYRREDAAGYAGRLFDRLVAEFGPEQVFIDVDSITPGSDFAESIQAAVASCDVVIELIGKNWLAIGPDGRRRLDDSDDAVRLTLATALRENKFVLPVLVEGATMPAPHDLPDELATLTRRNTLEITSARWDYDVGRLIESLRRILGEDRHHVA